MTTFLQLAVDMAVSNDFDEDHGHRYGTQPLSAWYAIVQPPGWTPTQLQELRLRLAEVDGETGRHTQTLVGRVGLEPTTQGVVPGLIIMAQ